jgi:hypothetical protein
MRQCIKPIEKYGFNHSVSDQVSLTPRSVM